MDALNTDLLISLADSQRFAELSGDFNPLHIDPHRARRTPFGTTVVHGAHVLLSAFEALARQGRLGGMEPEGLTVAFSGPVRTGIPFSLRIQDDTNCLRIQGHCGDDAVLRVTLVLRRAKGTSWVEEAADFTAQDPQDPGFPPAVTEGATPLRMNPKTLRALFPALAQLEERSWIADLLATTRIVGMHCPGLHSVFSGMTLHALATTSSTSAMRFTVSGIDERVRVLRLHVRGARLGGTLDTLFRSRYVQQRPLADLLGEVPREAFREARVLVVGGSRGLGELTAKLITAGGGDVTFTYARGHEEAERIVDETRAVGLRCRAEHMDVLDLASTRTHRLPLADYSHVYFFASPSIRRNPSRWSSELFEQYCAFYVSGFAALVDRLIRERTPRANPLRVLYPSTVFLDRPEPGFLEYVTAKAAGEALCRQLSLKHRMQIATPRLPRVLTDQTSASSDAADPLPVLLDVIRAQHA